MWRPGTQVLRGRSGGGHRGCEATAPEALAEKPAFSLVGPIASDRRLGRHNLRRLHRAVELADHLPLARGRQEFVLVYIRKMIYQICQSMSNFL